MKQKFIVEGMTCSACSSHVHNAVNKLDGITFCSVNLLSNSMNVEFNESICSTSIIEKAVSNAGYKAYIKGQNKTNNVVKENDNALVKWKTTSAPLTP